MCEKIAIKTLRIKVLIVLNTVLVVLLVINVVVVVYAVVVLKVVVVDLVVLNVVVVVYVVLLLNTVVVDFVVLYVVAAVVGLGGRGHSERFCGCCRWGRSLCRRRSNAAVATVAVSRVVIIA